MVQAPLPSALSLGFLRSMGNRCAAEWRARLLRRENSASAFGSFAKEETGGAPSKGKTRPSGVAGRAIVKTASKRNYWPGVDRTGLPHSRGGTASGARLWRAIELSPDAGEHRATERRSRKRVGAAHAATRYRPFGLR